MHKVAHLSDVHFGRVSSTYVPEALLEAVHASDVDLVAVSGDLTQRAWPWEFRRAAAFLDRFEPPVLVVPGNHDVYPWWRPFARLSQPLHRFRTHISENLRPRFRRDGLAVLGLNSAHGWTIKNGWIEEDDVEAMHAFYEPLPPGTFKVLVLHHHLLQLGFRRHDIARRAQQALRAVEDCGVDLILCGHLHQSHIERIRFGDNGSEVVVASAGTATSSRGRGDDAGINGFNLVEIEGSEARIEEMRYDPEEGRFTRYRRSEYERLVPVQTT